MKLISNKKNIEYLTGFQGSFGFLILGRKNLLFTDFRYKENVKKLSAKGGRIKFDFIEADSNLKEHLKKISAKHKEIQFESSDLSVDALKRWKSLIPKIKFVPIKNKIEDLRAQKGLSEIKLIKKSQQINERVFQEVKKALKIGVSELEVAWLIKVLAHEMGAEDISFEPIVAFGSNSATPHHHNSTRKLKKNTAVLIDMGMKYKSYCSDMTRSFYFGKAPAEYLEIYNLVLQAQLAGIKSVKAGVNASLPDAIARESMGEYAKYFGHSMGHGIGLEVHEFPSLSQKSSAVLQENMIITMEPGIYLEGKFGVRIEDMGRVTKNGFENFTKLGKEC